MSPQREQRDLFVAIRSDEKGANGPALRLEWRQLLL